MHLNIALKFIQENIQNRFIIAKVGRALFVSRKSDKTIFTPKLAKISENKE